jgi:hypothetical protein
MYHIEVKHDSNTEWTRLGVASKAPFSAIAFIIYAGQYAIDNQMNADLIAVRMIDSDGNVKVERASNATANRLT